MEDYIYLDNAATTFPKPETVYLAMDKANRTCGVNAGRGSYALAQRAEELIGETREQILTLTGAGERAEVVLTPSATFACNQILGGIFWKKGDVVYVSPYEHNAVIRVLHLLRKQYGFTVEELAVNTKTLELDLEKIKYQFIQNPPAVICMSHVSNVTGYILPVQEVASYVRESPVTVIVDGSQALGLVPVNLCGSPIDYYIFAGHKTLYGPLGVGGYIKNSQREQRIVFAGGTGSDSLNPEMEGTYLLKMEPGSRNVGAIAGLHASLSELGEDGDSMQKSIRMMRQREQDLSEQMIEGLRRIPGVNLYVPKNPEIRSGICSFTVEGFDSSDVGMLLDQDYGIAVRCGYHCAPLIHKYLQDKGYNGTVRASVGRFNTERDVEMLVRAVDEIARG